MSGDEATVRERFTFEIQQERARQQAKFPQSVRDQRPHLNRWERLTIYVRLLTEELGEVADAVEKSERGALPFEQVRKELIEVAALCLRTIEDEGLFP